MQKIALVTGTSSGIGLVSTLELARRGFHVIATMRDLKRQQNLLQAAQAEGVADRITLKTFDVTAFDTHVPAMDEFAALFGRIDVLVNNAGYALGGFAEDIELHELRAQLDTNFFGHVSVTRALLPHFRRQRSGRFIMVSSISGLVANPVTSSYSASKFALEGWTEALRLELRSVGIHVTLVEPGAFETDIWARNVRIGARALSDASLNRERASRFAEVVKNKLRKGDARVVGRLIADIAENDSPRLRYLVGKDARLRYIGKRLLPWKWYEKILIKASGIDQAK